MSKTWPSLTTTSITTTTRSPTRTWSFSGYVRFGSRGVVKRRRLRLQRRTISKAKAADTWWVGPPNRSPKRCRLWRDRFFLLGGDSGLTPPITSTSLVRPRFISASNFNFNDFGFLFRFLTNFDFYLENHFFFLLLSFCWGKQRKSFPKVIVFKVKFFHFYIIGIRRDLFWFLIFDFFLDEPGKQVRSAVRLKNTSRSHVAFKVFNLLKWICIIYYMLLRAFYILFQI